MRRFPMIRLASAFLAVLALWLYAPAASQAQGITRLCTPIYNPQTGALSCPEVSTTNPLPISGTFSATLSGFAPATQGTPITATTGGATGTLPAGTVVVVSNVGTTNAAYCALGASATTAAQPISPNGGWFAFTVGGATQITCATSTSTTTVNLIGGAGLPTGTGGGGGGTGSGGAITIADGADVTQGSKGDSPCATPSSSCTDNSLLRSIFTTAAGPLAISQTTPGVTNGVFVTNGIATALSTVIIAPNNTTAVNLVTGALTLYDFQGYTTDTAPVYLFLYDALTATCSSLTNIKRVWQVPVASTVANGSGSNISLPVGASFTTGMTYCFSSSLTSAVAPAANKTVVNLGHNP